MAWPQALRQFRELDTQVCGGASHLGGPVSAHSQSQASAPSSCSIAHWLQDSVQHLEPEATCLGSQTSWEHPGLTQRGPHNCGSQPMPAQSWPSHSRDSISFLETLGLQARFSESPTYKLLSREVTLGTLAGDFSDSDQRFFLLSTLRQERGVPQAFYATRGTESHARGTSVSHARRKAKRPDLNLQQTIVSCWGRQEERRPHRKTQAGTRRGWPPACQMQPGSEHSAGRGLWRLWGGAPLRRWAWSGLSLLLFGLRTVTVTAFVSVETL